MVFWRMKAAKPAATSTSESDAPAVAAEAADAPAPAGQDSNDAAAASEPSNVVALLSGRLSERLADLSGHQKDEPVVTAATASARPAASGARALDFLRAVLAEPDPTSHVLVFGLPGQACQTETVRIATELARDMPAPSDWVYVADPDRNGTLQPFPVPHGEGARLARDANAAIAKSTAMLARLLQSDDYRVTLDILEEEHRQRCDRVFETLRRRAEGQNIALLKTLDGYVLAPMHDGKVVRSEVFRALPEALQRDVEAKISVLQSDLQALVVALPEAELEADDKHAALSREIALRAVKPNIAITRKIFSAIDAAAPVLELIETGFVGQATEAVRRKAAEPPVAAAAACHAFGYRGDGAGTGAPVVIARSIAPADLCGEIGRDASGAVALRTGHLIEANGGFLIIEAWRLAADGRGWAALSGALESAKITPEPSPGLAVTAASVPLSLKLILIADEASWSRLLAIDPGAAQHFPTVARFEGNESSEPTPRSSRAELRPA